jgi:nucleosome binding factor SPN SPT16 subunit
MNQITVISQISVDFDRDAIVVPIGGSLVPFHISMVKNVTKTAQAETAVTTLFINFFVPGGGLPQADTLLLNGKTFIRDICFRTIGDHLSDVFRHINELKKRYANRLTEARNRAKMDNVPQEPLRVSAPGRPTHFNFSSPF